MTLTDWDVIKGNGDIEGHIKNRIKERSEGRKGKRAENQNGARSRYVIIEMRSHVKSTLDNIMRV